MPSWIDRLLVDLGRNIVEQGWADPWSSIAPMAVGDELGDRVLGRSGEIGCPDRDIGPDDVRHEFTASSSR